MPMSDSAPDTDTVADTDNVEQPTIAPTKDSRGILRCLARWIVKRYYPRIEITNGDRIPQSGPALLCANHANSLVDPVLIGVAAGRPVRFMAKAPLFDMPLLGPVMQALGMVPAFRGSDDASQVRRNVESLDVGAQVLVDGQAMGIFPEGKSTDEAHVDMVRSGAARMAIQAADDGAARVQVVPIGINYEQKDEFRSAVWIAVAEPIDVDACLQQHADKPRIARRELTEQLEARLKQVVVHLDEPEWEPWLSDLEVLAEAPREADRHPVPPLQLRKRIADAMNHFLATDRPRAESIASDIKEYRDQVTAAGLRVDSPLLKLRGWRVFAELLREFLWLLLLLVPAAVGTLQHLFPFVVVRALGKRFDQAGRKVVSTNRLFIGVPIYLLWYAVTAWWMFGNFANWFAWSWLIASPFCGIVAINYWRRACRAAELLWHQLRHAVSRQKLRQLREQDAALRGRIKELADQYAAHSPRSETSLRRSRKPVLMRLAGIVLIIAAIAAAIWIARYRLFDDPLSGEGFALQSIGPLGWTIATLNILAALVLLSVPKIRSQPQP